MNNVAEVASYKSDEGALETFNQANAFALQAIKEDHSLLSRYQYIVDRWEQNKARR